MQGFVSRKAEVKDAALLGELSRTTFYEAFIPTNPEDIVVAYVRDSLTDEILATELCNPESEVYFWSRASEPEIPVAFIKLNTGRAQTEPQSEEGGMELQRIYVRKEVQNQGLGQRMMDFVTDRAESMGARYVWLGVWEHNTGAQKFYARNGFNRVGQHVFTMGNEDQTDYILRRDRIR